MKTNKNSLLMSTPPSEDNQQQQQGEKDNTTSTSPSSSSALPRLSIFRDSTNDENLILSFKTPKIPSNGGIESILTPFSNPAEPVRFPIDIVCCIDTSGSMNNDAPVQDSTGAKESTGLNILQVVCQAVKTISAMLSEHDRLSVVTFSTNAQVGIPLLRMDDEGKDKVSKYLDSLEPHGRTNLFDGLVKSFDQLKKGASQKQQQQNRLAHIALLTDGRPTEQPEGGHLEALKQLIKSSFPSSSSGCPYTLSTYGFGYNLESQVLDSLAETMNGWSTFIPDSGLIASVFVNAISSILSMCVKSISIDMVTSSGTSAEDDEMCPSSSHSHCNLQYGGEHISWLTNVASAKNLTAAKISFSTPTQQHVTMTVPVQDSKELPSDTLVKYTLRKNFVDFVRKAARVASASTRTSFLEQGMKLAEQISQTAKESTGSTATLANALEADLKDQVLLALKNQEYLARWGNHYFFSLARANEIRFCNNFKDKSVQIYSSKVFDTLCEKGEAAFLKIPAPVPKGHRRASTTAGNLKFGIPTASSIDASSSLRDRATVANSVAPTTVARRPAASMATYYNRGGGCVFPDCQVLLADGMSSKAAEDIRRGDVLFGGGVVDCAVKIDKKNETMSMVFFEGGLVISEYHPVQLKGDNKTYFPIDLVKQGVAKQKTVAVDCLYTFVLKQNSNNNNIVSSPFININGVNVISWGHEQRGDEVVSHDLFSSHEKVVASLKKVSDEGYEQKGQVTVTGFVRDEETNRIVDLF